jgi:CHAD domain-containing protein
MTRHPHFLARAQLHELLAQFPGIRDADVESVHRARVATRRLRELIPLLPWTDSKVHQRALDTLRAAGRALGETRELDVMAALLARFEPRARFAPRSVSAARTALHEQLEQARRDMIKAVEHLEIDRLATMLAEAHHWHGIRLRFVSPGGWTRQLRLRLGNRAEAMRRAVHHASGVYFPNRLHRTRVAVKKLRYSVEAAVDTGFWRPPRLVKDLKQAQGTLGDIHDLQVLVDALNGSLGKHGDAGEMRDLTDLIRAEIADCHREYLRNRDRLEAAAGACARFSGGALAPRFWRRGPVIASTLAVPSAFLVLRVIAARAPVAEPASLGQTTRPQSLSETRSRRP